MKRFLPILVVMLVLSIGCTSDNAEVEQLRKELDEIKAAPPPATATPTATSRIAFQSDRDGDREIFVMDADGTHVQQLTDNDDSDSSPVWSPDGK